jgi:hypothetical protein
MEKKIAKSSNKKNKKIKKNKKKNESDKEITKESIKYALFCETSSFINVNEIFKTYFEISKPDPCKIKNQDNYIFSFLSNPQILLIINHFKKLEDANSFYELFQFFLIFIDTQNLSSNFLEKTIEIIIDEDENNLNKKFYIIGFYQKNDNEKLNQKDIINTANSKAIDYNYNEVNINDIESFGKIMEKITNDSYNILIEKYLNQKQSELIEEDNSNSQCLIY